VRCDLDPYDEENDEECCPECGRLLEDCECDDDCGCTEQTPCLLVHPDDIPGAIGVPCSWLDETHTLCSNLDCIAVVPLAELCAIVFPYAAPRAKAATP